MSQVNDYIVQLPPKQRAIMTFLDEFILDFPGVTSKLRYGIPFYYKKSWICYLNPIKNNGIELAFTRANELSNEQGLLDFKGRKQVAGLELFDYKLLPLYEIREVINEAMILDQHKPYASKRKPAK